MAAGMVVTPPKYFGAIVFKITFTHNPEAWKGVARWIGKEVTLVELAIQVWLSAAWQLTDQARLVLACEYVYRLEIRS